VSQSALAPEKPAERLEAIEHLDFEAERSCEMPLPESGECGATPVTHVLRVVKGSPCAVCGDIDPALVCTPCAVEVGSGLEDDEGWTCDHGVVVWLGVVPL
jgi:hypothetical protein